MKVTAATFTNLSPEWILLGVVTLLMLIVAFSKDKKQYLAVTVAAIALGFSAMCAFYHMNETNQVMFMGQYLITPLTSFLKFLTCLLMLAGLLYGRDFITSRNMQPGEYAILILFSTLGMLALISSNSLIVFYVALELLSLPLYAMVAMERNSGRASEAAMKYFVMGALASGFILYGISMLYGATGSLNLNEIAQQLQTTAVSHRVIFIFGAVFVVAGLAFKLGVAPFHMWAPDVYHGAPNPVAAIIASGPKVAAFAFFLRFLLDGHNGLVHQWHDLLIVMSVLSIVLGNVIAVVQTNVKRMLAYSSIAHMGFVFLALLADNPIGYRAAMFYVVTYVVMSMGAFALLTLVSKAGAEAETLNDLKGLNERNPWLALMMLLLMFSMAGVPPTVGFFAKLGVLNALVHANMTTLAVVAVLFAVVGAYYYLRVIRTMYFESASNHKPICLNWDERALISINGLMVLYLGIFPAGLMSLCQQFVG